MQSWDNLRYFLALHRHGRLIAAARANKKPLSNVKLKPADADYAAQKTVSYFDLFTHWPSLKLILVQSVTWYVCFGTDC